MPLFTWWPLNFSMAVTIRQGYTIALIGFVIAVQRKSLDFQKIWQRQGIDPLLYDAIGRVGRLIQDELTSPPEKTSNISEWAKRDACWQRLMSRRPEVEELLKPGFSDILVALDPAYRLPPRLSRKSDSSVAELEA